MIDLRMARVAPLDPPARPCRALPEVPVLAFRYLILFRRIVVSLFLLGAVVAWIAQWPALAAACVCVGIGELLESSYYLNVLRWRDGTRDGSPDGGPSSPPRPTETAQIG